MTLAYEVTYSYKTEKGQTRHRTYQIQDILAFNLFIKALAHNPTVVDYTTTITLF